MNSAPTAMPATTQTRTSIDLASGEDLELDADGDLELVDLEEDSTGEDAVAATDEDTDGDGELPRRPPRATMRAATRGDSGRAEGQRLPAISLGRRRIRALRRAERC